jgi:hypothetical protein
MLQVAAMQPFTLRVRCGGTVLELLHMIAKQRGPPALAPGPPKLRPVRCLPLCNLTTCDPCDMTISIGEYPRACLHW